jgi:hypothetical protein
MMLCCCCYSCYESLNFGLIEKVIPELTSSAHVQLIKEDVLEAETGADLLWDAFESGFASNKVESGAVIL